MNVFVLCTGRCGSTTFIRACKHITNYSAEHESRSHLLGSDRFAYPDDHIEADNRLAWFLGRLDDAYGDNAIYVHLVREEIDTARSFLGRWHSGIIAAYWSAILMGISGSENRMEVCRDYCHTVNTNIGFFLKDKSRKMTFSLENAAGDFARFWELIGANGDFQAAVREWEVTSNGSEQWARRAVVVRIAYKCKRIVARLPAFLRYT